jgi:hypothetical protein
VMLLADSALYRGMYYSRRFRLSVYMLLVS